MTICIAAISQAFTGNPKIVFASDRLATDHNGLTFELGVPKVFSITENCFVMNAGNSARADYIINKVVNDVYSFDLEHRNFLSVESIANIFKIKFEEVKEEAIQKEIFDNKSMTIKEFYENLGKFPDWFGILTNSSVDNFNFNVGFIIFGFDINQDSKIVAPHIFGFSDSGELVCWDSVGFAMIGIGYNQSVSEITKEPYNPSTSIYDALLKVYYSKKSAQRMTGVGEYTDLGIVEIIIDSTTGKIITKNSLASEQFKKSLDDKLEEQKKKMKEIEIDIKNKIESEFTTKVEIPNIDKK